MWWMYVLFICLFVAAVLSFFIYKKVTDKKTYEKLTKNLPTTLESAEEKKEEPATENLEISEEKTEENVKNDLADLEDFSFEEDKPKPEEQNDFSINPFRTRRIARSGGREKIEQDRQYHGLENKEDDMDFDLFDDEEESDEKDSKDENADLNEKFAEYEKFLRENLGIDDDEVENEPIDEDEFDFSDFDFESLKGKNKSEIDEIIKKLSPKAKEILLSDILARKDFDDDDK